MPRAERQLQICLCLTTLYLTARRLLACSPGDTLAARIRWRDLHCATCKPIAKYVAHIVPDLVDVKIVRKNRLADIWLENPAFDRANLDCNTARYRIAMKYFAVGSIFRHGELGADAATHGPQVNRLVALIRYNCATDGLRTNNEREGSDNKSSKKHYR